MLKVVQSASGCFRRQILAFKGKTALSFQLYDHVLQEKLRESKQKHEMRWWLHKMCNLHQTNALTSTYLHARDVTCIVTCTRCRGVCNKLSPYGGQCLNNILKWNAPDEIFSEQLNCTTICKLGPRCLSEALKSAFVACEGRGSPWTWSAASHLTVFICVCVCVCVC